MDSRIYQEKLMVIESAITIRMQELINCKDKTRECQLRTEINNLETYKEEILEEIGENEYQD